MAGFSAPLPIRPSGDKKMHSSKRDSRPHPQGPRGLHQCLRRWSEGTMLNYGLVGSTEESVWTSVGREPLHPRHLEATKSSYFPTSVAAGD